MLAYEELHRTHERIHREANEFHQMMREHQQMAREAHERHIRDHLEFDLRPAAVRPSLAQQIARFARQSLLTLEYD